MRLILAFLCATVAWAQYPVNGGLGGGGGGFTAPSGYSATVTGLTTLTVTAAQHGQGPAPTAWCFDNAVPALAVSCSYTVSSIGDVVFTWSPAFTGYILIRGPGASAGAAGDVVGPSSSTSGCVAYFSGTSGKIITCAPTGLFYDAATVRLGVGTGTPATGIHLLQSGAQISIDSTGFSSGRKWGLQSWTDGNLYIQNISAAVGMIAGSNGNWSIGSTTATAYKLDVQASGSTGTLRAYSQSVGGSTLVVVQAGDTQSGNLLSVRNNGGTELAYIDNTGSLVGSSIFVAAGGGFSFVGRSVIASPADGVLRLTNNAGTDFNRLQFGGTTSSFPALKRSSAGLQVRLADDSAFTTVQASNYISNDGSTGITGATCSSFKNGICVAP